MDLQITDRIALVTGADSGIGHETARLLLAEGARVAITDRDAEKLEAARVDLGGDVLAVPADLTVGDDVSRLRETVTSGLGAPEILVHAAGVTGAQGLFHEIDFDGWRQTFDTDFFSDVRVLQAFLPGMRGTGWGRVVLVSSEDAVQPYPDELPYCAAKAAVLTLAKGLAKTYGPEGVLVNTVSPAFIATPMTDAMMQQQSESKGISFDEAVSAFLDEQRPGITAKRRGRAEEVAAVIGFLCSERASFVNGSNYRVDSGSVMTV